MSKTNVCEYCGSTLKQDEDSICDICLSMNTVGYKIRAKSKKKYIGIKPKKNETYYDRATHKFYNRKNTIVKLITHNGYKFDSMPAYKEYLNTSEDLEIFKEIVDQLYAETGINRDTIIIKLLNSEYSKYLHSMTLAEIGFIYNLTRERVRQIVDQAERKLSQPKLRKLNKELKELVDIYTTNFEF